jgi:DNA-binding LytR/AlgR family response regulator
MEKANHILLESPANFMRFYVKGIVYCVSCPDIVYMETQNRYVVVHTRERKICVPYLKLSDCLEKGEGRFLRCHRSILVNPSYIQEIQIRNKQIILTEHRGELMIGRKYIHDVKGIFDIQGMSRYTGTALL